MGFETTGDGHKRKNRSGKLGMSKHRTSGTSANQDHFTGKQKSGTKRKRKSSRAERKKVRGTHVNKYAEHSVAPKRPKGKGR